MIEKILSGGQTGVDRAALDVALELGIPCGGWCPRGRRAEDGVIPARYPLQETSSGDYRKRTLKNVEESDGTLVIGRGKPTRGTRLTVEYATASAKPTLVVDFAAEHDPAAASAWWEEHGLQILNVAGPRESQAPGIYQEAKAYLRKLLAGCPSGRSGGSGWEDPSERSFLDAWCRASDGDPDEVEAALCAADERLGRVIRTVVAASGPQRIASPRASSHFEAIARSILYQQLSGKAAAKIYGRVMNALEGEFSPGRVVRVPPEALRAAGLSAAKVRYIRALAEAVLDGLELEAVERLPDEEVVAALTRVPGIGVWTAQMFLMFQLGRLDVLPSGDLGIRKGVQLAHGLRNPVAPGYVERVGQRWAPYRSIACLYLWAAMDLGSFRGG